MAEKRQRTRITSKITELPNEVRLQVDAMLVDTANRYEDISKFLKEAGYDISRSAVGRYALRSNSAMQRVLEAQAQTQRLIQAVQKNPDADYTEAGMMILMDGLIQRMATAEEEFDSMPLDKAGRLIASLSRTKVYKDKVKQEMKKKADLAFKEFEADIQRIIKDDAESMSQFKVILQKVKERMVADD